MIAISLTKDLTVTVILPAGGDTEAKLYQEKITLKTWSSTLLNEPSLPEDWVKANGVLVGTYSQLPSIDLALDESYTIIHTPKHTTATHVAED